MRSFFPLLPLLLPIPTALASDYDCDGYDDLAIGAPQESWGQDYGGAAHVLYGSSSGLTATGDDLFNSDTIGLVPTKFSEQFGSTLGGGDFDGDGCDELVMGSPALGIDTVNGGVYALYGTTAGLSTAGAQLFLGELYSDPPDATFHSFGELALAVGDFDNDGADDLVIGDAHAEVNGIWQAGAVFVAYGVVGGYLLDTEIWSQDSAGINGTAEESDYFGGSLAVADFDGDGYADLVIGAPYESLGGTEYAGGINLLFGGSGGLASSGNRFEDQGDWGGTVEADDKFGRTLAAGDFNGDGYGDLAAGTPGENANAGQVDVGYGSASGWTKTEYWRQGSSRGAAGALGGTAETGDFFGQALAVGDFDGDGYDDLAVGADREDLYAGAVSIVYGSSGGLTGTGDQYLTQDTSGVADTAESGDYFGFSLATGDYDGDGYDDLVIGAAYESLYASLDGAVHVLFGSATGITTKGDQIWSQDTTGVSGGAEDGDWFGWAIH